MTQPAALSDYNELLAFENRVFDVDFLSIMPKLYRDDAICAACHGVIKEGGKIIAALAAWPTAIETACGTLRVAGVGSVAVDPEARGKGCMKELMAFFERAAKEQDADLAFLSGSRGRYEHYGFRPCGSRTLVELTPYIVQHFAKNEDFVFTAPDEDAEALGEIEALFEAQPLHWARSKSSFSDALRTWGAECYAVREPGGAFCGYLLFERKRSFVSEILLHDWSKTEAVLVTFARHTGEESLKIAASPTQPELLDALHAFGEGIITQMPAAFKIYHWQRFIETLGGHKATYAALPEGSLVLQIGKEVLRVTIRDGRCTVTPTVDAPDLAFEEMEAAVRLTTTFGQYVPHPLFAAWAPLCPLDMPHPDGV